MSNKVSFRDTVLAQMGNFLLGVGFRISMAATQILKKELVEVANQLSDYYEEGTHLYPEVIILDDLSQFVKENPCIYNVFENGELKEKSLQRAIKMCAPLADNGWVIFIEVNGDNVAWGVLNVELSAVTTPVFNQMNPQYLMASDYIDYLDEGATPPKGSENWIATYAQEAFDKYIKRNDKLATFIKDNCSLSIE